ncbi:short-chain dehydrogenase, partial [Sinorhizobium medicae]
MKLGLEEKIAIVTGGGSGIGAAVSRQLGGEGAEVIVADRDADAARTVAAEIRSNGGKARDFTVDVADSAAVEQMVAFAVRECGGLHLAVNNAGVEGPRRATADYPLEDWRRLIEVN